MLTIDLKTKLINWGVSAEYFVLVIGDEESQEKMYFATAQGRAMDYLMQSYIGLKLGKIPTDQSAKFARRNQEKDKKPIKPVHKYRKFGAEEKVVKEEPKENILTQSLNIFTS